MKVQSKVKLFDIEVGQLGEAISFQVTEGQVYFRVLWYGKPGIYTVHHSQLGVVV